jgi:hypothetical protein
MYSVVIRVPTLAAHYPGGVASYENDCPNSMSDVQGLSTYRDPTSGATTYVGRTLTDTSSPKLWWKFWN